MGRELESGGAGTGDRRKARQGRGEETRTDGGSRKGLAIEKVRLGEEREYLSYSKRYEL